MQRLGPPYRFYPLPEKMFSPWDIKKITKEIGATSVTYISPAGFIRARFKSKRIILTKNPLELFLRNRGCGGCLTGLYPIDKQGNEYDSKNIEL